MQKNLMRTKVTEIKIRSCAKHCGNCATSYIFSDQSTYNGKHGRSTLRKPVM